jgi:hypothetical protein
MAGVPRGHLGYDARMSDIAEIATLYTRTIQISWNRYSEIMGFRQMAKLGAPAATSLPVFSRLPPTTS